jgi:histidine kinase/DNA gyrase B/HSP90-like ATPase
VSDSGVGIDPKDLDKLFNAFYTIKSHGMGMGLSISRSIDRRTPTRIRVYNTWVRHPDFTALQIIERLGTGQFRNVRWVQQVLMECRRRYAKPSQQTYRRR